MDCQTSNVDDLIYPTQYFFQYFFSLSIRCTEDYGHVVGHLHRGHVRLFLQQVAELSSAAEKEVPQPAGPQPQPEGSQGVQDGRG